MEMRCFGAVLVLIGLTNLAQAADGDPAKGEQSFRICGACHSIGADAKNKIGPELNGVVGRKWGSVDDYSYSSDLSAGKDQAKVWDEATLNDYLENPKHLAPHGKMSFAGFKSENQRADVIAYLKQFDDKGNKK
jgi:cytochrome c